MSPKLHPDKGTLAENIAKKYFPCTCGEIYLSRKLTAPDCPYHAFDWEEAFEEYAASSPKISGEESDVSLVAKIAKYKLKYADKPYEYDTYLLGIKHAIEYFAANNKKL